MKDYEKTTLNLRWIIGVLLIVTVFVIAFRAKNNTEVIEFISFAATLSSILLSIIAIVYTFITSNSGTSINENMRNISDKLLHQAEELNIVYQRVAAITCSIPEKIEQMNNTINETIKVFEKNDGVMKKPDKGIRVDMSTLTDNNAYIYVLFYCINLICTNKVAIDISKIADALDKGWKDTDNLEFVDGFFKGLRSTGVIYFEYDGYIFYNFDRFENDFSFFNEEKVLERIQDIFNEETKEDVKKRITEMVSSVLDNIRMICSK